MKCEICGRKAKSGFCDNHEKAHRNLLEKYEAWRKSMDISWREYLEQISKNPYTGIWVKEVVRNLLVSRSSEDYDSSSNKSGKT
jgi:hypothetical protein